MRIREALESFLLILAALVIAFSGTGCVSTPSAEELDSLKEKVVEEMAAGDYAHAVDKVAYITSNTRKTLGAHSSQYAIMLGTLAICLTHLERCATADSVFEIAEMILVLHPRLDSIRAQMLLRHGQSKVAQSKYVQAESLFAEGLKIQERLYGVADYRLEDYLKGLDLSHMLQRDFAGVLPVLERRLKITLLNPDFQMPALVELIKDLERLCFHLSRCDQGNQLMRSVIAFVDSGGTKDRRPLPVLQLEFAAFLFAQGRLDDTTSMFKRALASAEEIYVADGDELGRYLGYHAGVLRQIGMVREADAMAARADSLLSKQPHQ